MTMSKSFYLKDTTKKFEFTWVLCLLSYQSTNAGTHNWTIVYRCEIIFEIA